MAELILMEEPFKSLCQLIPVKRKSLARKAENEAMERNLKTVVRRFRKHQIE